MHHPLSLSPLVTPARRAARAVLVTLGLALAALALPAHADSTTFIPPGQTFLLGGDQRTTLRLEGRNVGDVAVERRTDGAGGPSASVRIEPGQSFAEDVPVGRTVRLRNPSADRRATLRISLNQGVQGLSMRYVGPGADGDASARATPAAAPAKPVTAVDAERSLAGRWRGALRYRDYQSNEVYELPMDTRVTVGPDDATLTRVSSFDDGPKTGFVHITTVSLFDQDGTQVTSATFRRGHSVESWTESARVIAWRDATHWSVSYEREGRDDERPARIRITQARDGDRLTTRKEVRPVGAADAAYALRNETVLDRVAP